jgi:aryl-alcohol dehydrogenase-like predicted oxidoreductase
LVLGGNVFGGVVDEPTSFAIIDAFLDAGFNAIDTADTYSQWLPGNSGGESETVIGAWIKARGRRHDFVLASKVGSPRPGWGEGLSAAYIVKSAEASLQRLQTDYLDLYQAHRDDQVTPLEESMEAFDRLIRAGKVRAVGASHFEAERLSEALEVSERGRLSRYDSFQPRYNLCDRVDYGPALQKVCTENEVGVLAYSGLAKGFLTGKYRDRATVSQSPNERWLLERYFNPRGLRILEVVDEIAAAHDATPAEISLAWLMAHPGVVAPIMAVSSVDELQEVIGAARVTLDGSQFDALAAAGAV